MMEKLSSRCVGEGAKQDSDSCDLEKMHVDKRQREEQGIKDEDGVQEPG